MCADEAVRYPGAGVRSDCEHPQGCWDQETQERVVSPQKDPSVLSLRVGWEGRYLIIYIFKINKDVQHESHAN